MGDIEFIEGKVTSGDYFQVSGLINALGDTIEFKPDSGKTAFLIEAKIVMITNPDAAAIIGATSNINDQVVASLKIDNAEVDRAKIGIASRSVGSAVNDHGSGSGFGASAKDNFNVLGLSLVGDGVKKIEIENILDNGSAFATMSGYVI